MPVATPGLPALSSVTAPVAVMTTLPPGAAPSDWAVIAAPASTSSLPVWTVMPPPVAVAGPAVSADTPVPWVPVPSSQTSAAVIAIDPAGPEPNVSAWIGPTGGEATPAGPEW